MVGKESLTEDCNTLNSYSDFNHDSKFSSQKSIKKHFVLLLRIIKQWQK